MNNQSLLSLIGLSDREKFHTGMLAYLFQNDKLKELLVKELFGLQPIDLNTWKVFVEEDSIDLGFKVSTVKKRTSLSLLIEVKLKSTTTIDQIAKYSKKLHYNKHENNYGKFFILALFEPLILTNGNGNFAYHFQSTPPSIKYGKKEEHINIIRPSFISYSLLSECLENNLQILKKILDKDEYGIYYIWVQYIKKLTDYSNFIVGLTISSYELKEFDKKYISEIRGLRLLGAFERYRFEQFFKLLENVDSGKFKYHFNNSHGNSLFEINKDIIDPEISKIGLQWQNDVLKVFISNKIKPKKNENQVRDVILANWFNELKLKFEKDFDFFPEAKINKKNELTQFRSVNLFKKSVFENITIEFVKAFDKLTEHILNFDIN